MADADPKPEAFDIDDVLLDNRPNSQLLHMGCAFMVKFLGRNPTVTYKRFVHVYITYYCRFAKKNATGGIELCKIDSDDQVERMVDGLIQRFNVLIREIGLRICKTKDEETGNTLIVLITESSHNSLIPFTKFSQDEIYLIHEYVDNIMRSAGGSIDRNLTMHMARNLPNPMSLMKAQDLMDRLIREKWFKLEEDEGELTLAPRAIAELENYLNKKYLTVSCVVCRSLVIHKNVSVQCENCNAETHASCRQEIAKSVRGENIACRERGCGHETPREEWASGKGQRRFAQADQTQEAPTKSAKSETSLNQSQSSERQEKTPTQSQKRKAKKRIVISDSEDEDME